uniref:piggyBac transposable element-derived protein 4-like n=1 Tax=Styela clava TaxID=7725 RepID=UPI00193997DA|nr:piggyBac transposable element-derived protein 4-like [Styela clava]
MEELDLHKFEEEINSGSESIYDSLSDDEDSLYDDFFGQEEEDSTSNTITSVSTTPVSIGRETNFGSESFAQPVSKSSSDTDQSVLSASYASSDPKLSQSISPQSLRNIAPNQHSSDSPTTSLIKTRGRRVGRPLKRSWCRGRPRIFRSPEYRSGPSSPSPVPMTMSPAITPTSSVSSPSTVLPSTPRQLFTVWDENESANPPQAIPFSGQPRHHLEEPISPLSVLSQFLNNNFWENITFQTNLYAKQEKERIGNNSSQRSYINEWKPVTANEIKVFIGIILAMGLVKKPHLKNYWSKRPIYASSFYSGLMPRDRFLSISTFLHLNDNTHWVPYGQVGHNPLHKIQPFLNLLKEKFETLYYPEKALSLDEGLCPFKGRVRFRSYMKRKPKKWGIKIYELCESRSGYCVSFKIATGKVSDQEDNSTHGVVMNLMQNYLGVGHEVYTDRYYTSPKLFAELYKEKTIGVGTCRIDRRGLPRTTIQQRLGEGQIVSARKGPLLALKWRDKRDVLMLSTKHINDTKSVQVRGPGGCRAKIKPVVVQDYNDNMAGVDKSDQMLSYYSFERKTKRWWKKLFFRLFNLTIVNSHKLYSMAAQTNHDLKRLNLLEYIEELVYKLTCEARSCTESQSHRVASHIRLSGRHFPKLNVASGGRQHVQRSCHVCSLKSRLKRKKQETGSRARNWTQYHCPICNVFLHVDPCFEAYHTMDDYGI